MKFLRVTAPYVTLKLRDSAGAWVVTGVYKGGVFPFDDVEAESRDHHIESGLAEAFTAAADGDEPKPGAAQNPPPAPETVEDQQPAEAETPKKAGAKKSVGA